MPATLRREIDLHSHYDLLIVAYPLLPAAAGRLSMAGREAPRSTRRPSSPSGVLRPPRLALSIRGLRSRADDPPLGATLENSPARSTRDVHLHPPTSGVPRRRATSGAELSTGSSESDEKQLPVILSPSSTKWPSIDERRVGSPLAGRTAGPRRESERGGGRPSGLPPGAPPGESGLANRTDSTPRSSPPAPPTPSSPRAPGEGAAVREARTLSPAVHRIPSSSGGRPRPSG
ncbi:hypothetical protein THAOC_03900, partial [Thalassiosira oceanica]